MYIWMTRTSSNDGYLPNNLLNLVPYYRQVYKYQRITKR